MLGLAKALMQQERYAEGLALIGEILIQDPTNQELWTLQGNAYLSMGKHTEATKTIEKARRLGAASPEMLATLGDLLLNQEQPEDALLAYNDAFSKEKPSIPRMLRAVEGFLITGDTVKAQNMISRIESLPPDTRQTGPHQQDTTLLRLKAELAQQQGNTEEAIDLCETILVHDPLDGRTMLILAELQRQTGAWEAAVMTCERAARLDGFEADALLQQAQIEILRENYERAVKLLEASLTFDNRSYVDRYLQQVRRMID
jgi:tetratricopeptide (TPR) repeat protein